MESDSELIDRVQRGDQRAFAELVSRHRVQVFNLAVSILGPTFVPEAEDVAQEVFLKAHRSLKSFRGDAEFGSWLYRITFNQTVNMKALARFRKPHVHERALEILVSSEAGPDQQAETTQRDQVLAECIQTLPDAYQSALRLYYWLGKGVGEIAELLGVPENTVKSYLHRARLLLHSKLKERGY